MGRTMSIDWSRIADLREEIGADDFAEVVTLFMDEMDEGLTVLRHAGDASSLEAQFHFLKGSALNLGFAELAKLCQRGETAAAKGQECHDLRDATCAAFEASKAEFLTARDENDHQAG